MCVKWASILAAQIFRTAKLRPGLIFYAKMGRVCSRDGVLLFAEERSKTELALNPPARVLNNKLICLPFGGNFDGGLRCGWRIYLFWKATIFCFGRRLFDRWLGHLRRDWVWDYVSCLDQQCCSVIITPCVQSNQRPWWQFMLFRYF